jgi:hypothetical protein
MPLIPFVLAALILGPIGALPSAQATDLSYPSLVPQSTPDLDAVMQHKNYLFEAPKLYVNAATSGTYPLQALTAYVSGTAGAIQTTGTYPGLAGASVTGTNPVSMIERLSINTPGAAGANVVLLDGTVPIATVQATSVGTYTFESASRTGTLSAIATGTANWTVTYR